MDDNNMCNPMGFAKKVCIQHDNQKIKIKLKWESFKKLWWTVQYLEYGSITSGNALIYLQKFHCIQFSVELFES